MRRLAKHLEELRPWHRALDEDRIVERHLGDALHRAQRRVAREQYERPPVCALKNLDHFTASRSCKLWRSRVGHPRRQVEQRLPFEIEFRREANFIRATDPEPR